MVVVGPEDQIGILFLLVGHAVVQRLEDRCELSYTVGMRVCGLTVGLEIIHGVHAVHLTHASRSKRVHRVRVVAHDLRDLLPERFLRLSDLKPAVKAVDARVNRLVGCRGHHMCWCGTLRGRRGACRARERRYREKEPRCDCRCTSWRKGGSVRFHGGLRGNLVGARQRFSVVADEL